MRLKLGVLLSLFALLGMSACPTGNHPADGTAPAIAVQPANQTVTAPATATFTVNATGAPPLTYAWQSAPSGSSSFAAIAGAANSNSYTTPATSTGQSGMQFRVVVSNGVNPQATSNPATLTVNAAGVAPSITTQPTNQTVTVGLTATFTVVAAGTAPLSYQWQSAPSGSSTYSNVGSATPSPSLAVMNTTLAQSGSTYRVIVSNSANPSATSNAATLTVNPSSPVAPSITLQPTNQTVTAGLTATFTVVATGTAPLSYQWQSAPSGSSTYSNVGSASSVASLAVMNTTLTQSGSTYRVVVSNGVNPPATSDPATLTVNPVVASNVTVLTYHNDIGRTGQNLSETMLTPSNVNSTNFGLLGAISVDGPVDAEPLYVGNLTINGGTHNTLFVVTENDSVYAFDADSFALLWQKSMVPVNETPSDQVNNCSQVTPTIGITSTPVIDLSAGAHGTIFLMAMTKDSGGNYHQRLHALDITTGAERADISSPTTIQGTASGDTFDPKQYEERVGLLLLNGAIYVAWTSHCDAGQYNAWVMGYSESTLQQTSIINLTPGGGGGIWMAGAGLAADSGGNIYFLDGNGVFDSTQGALQANGNYGNAFIKLSTSGGVLSVADFFSTHDTVQNSNQDLDLGSGGALVLPDLRDNSGTTWHLAVGAGKKDSSNGNAIIFVVNRDSMGKFSSTNDSAVYQELITTNTNTGLEGGTGVFAMPAYFNNKVYYGAVDDNLKAFSISNAKLVSPAGSQSPSSFGYPGATPSVSANGSSGGIVWAIENAGGGVLHAFDAADLSNELYNSNQAGNRDHFSDNKFVTPMIANGKVYVGTRNSVAVFGLLSPSAKLRRPRSTNPRQHRVPAYVAPHPGSSTPGE